VAHERILPHLNATTALSVLGIAFGSASRLGQRPFWAILLTLREVLHSF